MQAARGLFPAQRRSPRGSSVRTRLRAALRRIGEAAAAGCAFLAMGTVSVSADALPTVVSLNVCTDQLAMMVAAQGQILSVSNLSTDPSLSFLAADAARLPKNRGLAEEVFVSRPDVVVTGTYSLHNTTQLLRHLGYRVEEFAFNQSLEAIPADIRRMGRALGRDVVAEDIATRFEREKAELERPLCGKDPSLVVFEQNGIALGAGTLGDAAVRLAGFRNLAAENGVAGMAPLPLETLVTLAPDVIVLPKPLAGTPALADTVATHPAFRAMQNTRTGSFVPRTSWTCGGPFVLEAVKALRNLRKELVACAAEAR